MKKILFTFFLVIFGLTVSAQKIAYVDTDYILDNVPEYTEVKKELDKLSKKWQTEIERKYEEIDKLYKAYQAEQILLTEEMRKQREEEIIQKERAVKELQKQKFGVEGELFKKRQELIQPIQDKVYAAIKKVATNGGYTMVFDKAGQSNLLFANAKYDKSEAVLKKMGYSSN